MIGEVAATFEGDQFPIVDAPEKEIAESHEQ
jgi:hypothetical protein